MEAAGASQLVLAFLWEYLMFIQTSYAPISKFYV